MDHADVLGRMFQAGKLQMQKLWVGSKPDYFVVVQLLRCVWLFATPWTAALQTSLSFLISCSLLKLMSNELVMLSNHLILYLPLLLWLSVFSSIRVFYNESARHIRWSKYQSFSFSISPSNEYSGLISFRINWFDCLAVQGTLKSLLHSPVPQFESINSLALSLLCSWTLTSVIGLLEKP